MHVGPPTHRKPDRFIDDLGARLGLRDDVSAEDEVPTIEQAAITEEMHLPDDLDDLRGVGPFQSQRGSTSR